VSGLSGLVFRHATPDDAWRAAEVVRAFETESLGRAETTAQDVEEWWRELDPGEDVWLVDDQAGATLAYAALAIEGDGLAEADGYVVPGARGRGLGSYLVDATEARAVAQGARLIHNGVFGQDAAACMLLESAGYSAARRFAQMVVDLDEAPSLAEPPPGVLIRTFRRDADERAFHAALQESFADHWGFVPEPFERWRKYTVASPRFDPGLWLIADEGGAFVGVVRCTWKRNDMGWINDLGVLPAARRRGIAVALLTRAFAEFYRRGERHLGLGVDTRNETGATKLYERVGMRMTYSNVIYEKKLA
jgi:mycothiol synthase